MGLAARTRQALGMAAGWRPRPLSVSAISTRAISTRAMSTRTRAWPAPPSGCPRSDPERPAEPLSRIPPSIVGIKAGAHGHRFASAEVNGWPIAVLVGRAPPTLHSPLMAPGARGCLFATAIAPSASAPPPGRRRWCSTASASAPSSGATCQLRWPRPAALQHRGLAGRPWHACSTSTGARAPSFCRSTPWIATEGSARGPRVACLGEGLRR